MSGQYFDAAELIDEYLKAYQADNELTDEEMEERRKPDQLQRILPDHLFVDAARYNRFIQLMVDSITQYISKNIVVKKISHEQVHDTESLAYQELKGAHSIFLAFSGKGNNLLVVAEKFANKRFTEMDASAYDSVCEFINTAAGKYASVMSEENVMLDITAPLACRGITMICSNSTLYCLPVVIDDIEIEMIFSFDSEVNLECKEECKKAGILVVDDSEIFRSNMKKTLEDAGYTIVGEAANGTEAVEKYMELRPAIATMDITMPEKDGLTALKEILEQDPEAKVVMVSATAQKTSISKALMLGAYGFLQKPFDPDKTKQMISEIMAYSD